VPSLADIHIRLGDFGRARSLVDDEYMGDQSEKIFVLWAAPEVLTDVRYSTKSDVWALAVVFWEVRTQTRMHFFLRILRSQDLSI
jgi:serine/threonine protein kinase